jgi:hypothetical protein
MVKRIEESEAAVERTDDVISPLVAGYAIGRECVQ